MPFFSVIIPVYNKQNFVFKTIQSVLNQTFIDFEIIIVNDGSTDNSEIEILKFKDLRIKYIKTKNQGLSAARNTGIKNANSNFITLLDADDVWDSNFLKKIVSLIHQFPNEKIFATNYLDVYPNGIKIGPKNNSVKFGEQAVITHFFSQNLGQPFYIPSSLCIEKSVFDVVGYFDEKITFGEDVDFNIRSNLKFNVAFSKTPLVEYTVSSENQITSTGLKNKTIPNFMLYEKTNLSNSDLKKYLDFNRYIIAKMYKLGQDFEKYKIIKNQINLKNLNFKQKCLLKMPRIVLLLLKYFLSFISKFGFRFSSYS